MPRFYLHLRGRGDEILDPEGAEFTGLAAARAAALAGARDDIAQDIQSGVPVDLCRSIHVENEAREILHRLDFGDAVEILPCDKN